MYILYSIVLYNCVMCTIFVYSVSVYIFTEANSTTLHILDFIFYVSYGHI